MVTRNRAKVLVSILVTMGLIGGGCAAIEGAGPEEKVLTPEEAFDTSAAWLQQHYPDKAPGLDISWTIEDVEVLGRDGEPLLGAAQKRFSSENWEALLSWAIVQPDYLTYHIILRSPTHGWYWEGSVRAVGGMVTEEKVMQEMTEELAVDAARQFVKSSPTFMSSGISETLELVGADTGERPYSWTVEFEFDSRHYGYGDTSDEVTLPVITPHHAAITIEAMKVVEAIMDGKWNMLEQEFIASAEGARKVAEDFVRHSPTFVFDGIEETLELEEEQQLDVENAWTFVFRFDSRHFGYGDRTGEPLLTVITPHEAHITVENGEVVSALLDEKWDMLGQEMVN